MKCFYRFLQVRDDLEHKAAQVAAAAAEAKAKTAAEAEAGAKAKAAERFVSPKDEMDEDNAQTPEAAAMADGTADIDVTMADLTSDSGVSDDEQFDNEDERKAIVVETATVGEAGMIRPACGDELYFFGSGADGVKYDFPHPVKVFFALLCVL